MDIIRIVNLMQPNTISKFALKATDFPNGETGVPYMGGFAQLFPNAVLPDPVAVTAYVMPAAAAAIPDLATQLATALIAKGTITADDLNPKTVDTINATLIAAQLPVIK